MASKRVNYKTRHGRASSRLKATCLFVCTFLLSLQTASASDLATARQRLEHIEQLMSEESEVRPWQRDGLNSRIDYLGLALVNELNETAAQLLSSAELDQQQGLELFELLDEAAALALARDKRLEERAAQERETIDKFEQSAQADIARAFMEDLLLLREQYFLGYVDQLEVRRNAGLDVTEREAEVRERVFLIIERLTGQIRLDAMSLAELRLRLRDKPLDENLKSALTLVQAKQSQSLDGLEYLIEIGERLGLETAEQRSLLIRERGRLGVEILDREVFGTLWDEQVQGLRERMAREGPDLLLRVLIFLVVLLGAWVLARLIRYPVRGLVRRKGLKMSTLLGEVVISVSSAFVLVGGVIAALAFAGVSLGPLLAGLGVLGIVAGLAVQDSLSNLAAGAMILIYRPYDVDDHVRVSSAEGLVKRMNLLATTISTLDNQSVVVPNGRIWGDTIVNYTAHRVRRVDLKVSVAYAEDSDRVQSVLMDVLKNHELVLNKPEPVVHVAALEASAVAMMAKPWVKTQDYWKAYWDLTRVIKKRFDAEGIEIPFPQRVVTLVGEAEAAGSPAVPELERSVSLEDPPPTAG